MNKAVAALIVIAIAAVGFAGYFAVSNAMLKAEQRHAEETRKLEQRITTLEQRANIANNNITQLAKALGARTGTAATATAAAPTAAPKKPALPNLNTVKVGAPKAVSVDNP
jgi:uncharacterized MAPEG superfamily protein